MCTKHSMCKDKLWWKCVKKSSAQCHGSMKTDLQLENPETVLPHNHASDDAQVRLAKIQNTMKTQAANTRDKHRQSLAQALGQCDVVVVVVVVV